MSHDIRYLSQVWRARAKRVPYGDLFLIVLIFSTRPYSERGRNQRCSKGVRIIVTCKSIKHAPYSDRKMKNKPICATHSFAMLHTHTRNKISLSFFLFSSEILRVLLSARTANLFSVHHFLLGHSLRLHTITDFQCLLLFSNE